MTKFRKRDKKAITWSELDEVLIELYPCIDRAAVIEMSLGASKTTAPYATIATDLRDGLNAINDKIDSLMQRAAHRVEGGAE
jgi:hypothetical protein